MEQLLQHHLQLSLLGSNCSSSQSHSSCSRQLRRGSPAFFEYSSPSTRRTLFLTILCHSDKARCFRSSCKSRRSTVAFARQSGRGPSSPPSKKDKGFHGNDDDDLGPFERSLETEEEAMRRSWVTRFWAPWEEELSPEAKFAVEALNLGQGDEPIVPMEMMDRLNENIPIIPDKVEEEEDPDVVEALENGAVPGTAWKDTMVFALVPPRDWPPPGWKVNPEELAIIREAHAIADRRVKLPDLTEVVPHTDEGGNFTRWNTFQKQYVEWLVVNKEILDRDAEELAEEYYPGRRRMGENYVDGMYELPLIYPGQHYVGEVTMVHLYEGAFVNINAVHDGWVPIKRNDWFWVRDKIKVGMRVQVEVIAKRDPYRFRFPIELRFVHPNIDHLIFNRFSHPPIFVRKGEEANMDLITKEAGRPYWPRRRPDPDDPKEKQRHQRLKHPYIFKVWQLHVAEQTVLDEEDKQAAGIVSEPKKFSEIPGKRRYIDKDTWVTEEKIGNSNIPSAFYFQHPWELDMEGARKERKALSKSREEAKAKGEKFRPMFRRVAYMLELLEMHNQRYEDEKEAAERDRICRLEFGLPLEEPGKYADDSFFGENSYNPREKRWRHDYIGDVSKTRSGGGKKGKESRPQARDDEDAGPTTSQVRYPRPGFRSASDAPIESSPSRSSVERETTRNGDKVVNGTESTRILDIKGTFKTKEDQTGEDATDEATE